MDIKINTVTLGNSKLQKKHVEQMNFLNPLEWDDISVEEKHGQLVEVMKCLGYVNLKSGKNTNKYYIFSDSKGNVFKFPAIDWSIPKSPALGDKTLYFKNRYKQFNTHEDARQYSISNKHIIQHKLVETQIFI